MTLHEARTHNNTDLEIYKIAVKRWKDKKPPLKYNELRKDLIKHKNTKSFLNRFKVVEGNLSYSHTIVAHIANDGHYYIHPDIKQNDLSHREKQRDYRHSQTTIILKVAVVSLVALLHTIKLEMLCQCFLHKK